MNSYTTYDPSAKQKLFHSIKPWEGNLIKAAIGALSGGKTTACEQEQVLRCLQTPNGTSIACRFSLTDTGPTLLKDYQRLLQGIANWQEAKSKFVFQNGHELFVVPAKKFDRFGSQELVTFYIQEAQEAPWEVFDALTQRLRHKAGLVNGVPKWCGLFDARGIDTKHWIYEKFIENAWNATTTPVDLRGRAKNPAWAWVQFSTLDNPHQRPGYVTGLYNAHRTDQKWIRVFLHGEVGTAVEGSAVFEEFDPAIHVGKITEDLSLPMLRGVDFGYRHPAVVWAQFTRQGQFLVLRELTPKKIRRDDLASEVEALQRAEFPDRDNAAYQDFGDVAGEQEGTAVLTEVEFWENRFSTTLNSTKKFLKNGHEIMRDLMARTRKIGANTLPLFMVDESCRTLITALGGGYCFRKRDVDGVEYVEQDNPYKDVCLTGETMVRMADGGLAMISVIRPGEYVATHRGPQRVAWAGMTKKRSAFKVITFSDGSVLNATSNHPIFTDRGVISVDSLRYGDKIVTWQKDRNLGVHSSNTAENASTSAGSIGSLVTAASCFSGPSGNESAAQFRVGGMSITSTATPQIMTSRISHASAGKSIWPSTLPIPGEEYDNGSMWLAYDRSPQRGTDRQKEWRGMRSMARSLGRIASRLVRSAKIAAYAMRVLSRGGSARIGASALRDGDPASITKTGNASFAAKTSGSTGTPKPPPVPVHVVSVRDGYGEVAVYNLEVERAHAFYANDVYVHNCDATRFICQLVTQDAEYSSEFSNQGNYGEDLMVAKY